MGSFVQAIEIDPAAAQPRLKTRTVQVPEAVVQRLSTICPVSADQEMRIRMSRDWWQLGSSWAVDNLVGQITSLVARPADAAQVSAVMRVCNEAKIPVIPACGRSGGCGGLVPVFGGVTLDLTAMSGIVSIDEASMIATVRPATFLIDLETELRARGFTLGHWPQSVEVAMLGGAIACRGAGQLAGRYGKIEDMVDGLEVVLADGRIIQTGGAPRASAGPDLTQVFVGSEGTLGVITECRMRLRRKPSHEYRMAFGVSDLPQAMEAARRIVQAGATPAVLRCHEPKEAQALFGFDGVTAPLYVFDEGDEIMVGATRAVVERECAGLLEPIGPEPVDRWFEQRNEYASNLGLFPKGFVFDTLDVAGPWSKLPAIYDAVIEALSALPHIRAASGRLTHAYPNGGALYFTMVARPPWEEREAAYNAMWDVGTRAVLANGGNVAHHHGIGLNRSRFMKEALGPAHEVMQALKTALDPNGVCNPGKLGFASPFGEVNWP
jgi:alkyldihydroxyacetonephosphate synthase